MHIEYFVVRASVRHGVRHAEDEREAADDAWLCGGGLCERQLHHGLVLVQPCAASAHHYTLDWVVHGGADVSVALRGHQRVECAAGGRGGHLFCSTGGEQTGDVPFLTRLGGVAQAHRFVLGNEAARQPGVGRNRLGKLRAQHIHNSLELGSAGLVWGAGEFVEGHSGDSFFPHERASLVFQQLEVLHFHLLL